MNTQNLSQVKALTVKEHARRRNLNRKWMEGKATLKELDECESLERRAEATKYAVRSTVK